MSTANRRTVVAIAVLVVAWAVLMAFRVPIRIRWWTWQLGRTSEPAVRTYYANMLAAYATLAVDPVGRLLDHPEPGVRLIAVGILDHAETAHAEEVLLAALRDRSPEVSQAAALVLARLQSEAAMPVLRQMLDEVDEQVVCTSIVALQRFGSDRARRLVATKLANTSSERIRVQAIESCGLMRAAEAIPTLIDLLADARPVTTAPAGRAAALSFLARNPQKLAEMNLPPYVPVIEENLTIADEAARALRAITSQSFGFNSQDPPARREAVIQSWRTWWDGQKAM
jgi:HEAT repeat protein